MPPGETGENNVTLKALELFGKYFLLPIVTAAAAWYFSTGHSDANKAKAEKGYETLAIAINDQVFRRLEQHELRLDTDDARLLVIEMDLSKKDIREPVTTGPGRGMRAVTKAVGSEGPRLKVPGWVTAPASAPAPVVKGGAPLPSPPPALKRAKPEKFQRVPTRF